MTDPERRCPICNTDQMRFVEEKREPGYVPIDKLRCANGHDFIQLAMTAKELREMGKTP